MYHQFQTTLYIYNLRNIPLPYTQQTTVSLSVGGSPHSSVGLEAPSPIVAGQRPLPARLDLGEVPGAAHALGLHPRVHADERGPVGVDHDRLAVDHQHVGARRLAVEVLEQALVDAHHRDVDAHFLLDLWVGGEIEKKGRFSYERFRTRG